MYKKITRTTDTKVSEIISQWLYSNLYNKLDKGNWVVNVDRLGQLGGIEKYRNNII